MKKKASILLFLALITMASCTKPVSYGDININIDYSINGNSLITDSLCYTNAARNEFMITEIQWFISRIELQDERGDWFRLDHKEVEFPFQHTTDWVFYIDTNIPESQTLEIAPIPVGQYKTLRFVFGLNEEDNQTGLFTDPPESEMFWPDFLGGGYHYMKLNGKYLNAEGRLAPLAIHLGIGQNEDCTEFYQNYFTVELPMDFTVSENTENQLDLCMIVDNWFCNPNLYDFNVYGSAIMQNQAAQQVLKENGKDVFRIVEKPDNENNTNMEKDNGLTEKFKTVMQKAAPKPHFWRWENVKERFQDLKISNFKISNFKISN